MSNDIPDAFGGNKLPEGYSEPVEFVGESLPKVGISKAQFVNLVEVLESARTVFRDMIEKRESGMELYEILLSEEGHLTALDDLLMAVYRHDNNLQYTDENTPSLN